MFLNIPFVSCHLLISTVIQISNVKSQVPSFENQMQVCMVLC